MREPNIPNIRAAIDRLLTTQVMSEVEALNRLAQHARADIGEFTYVDGAGCVVIDFQAAKEKGLTHLIRKMKTKTTKRVDAESGKTEVEQAVDVNLQDQQAALDKILKAHGSYRDWDGGLHVEVNREHVNVFQRFNQAAQGEQGG